VPTRPKSFSAVPPLRLAKPQRSVLLSVQDVPGIGHNGGPALSDADLISDVLARGLQSAVATHSPLAVRLRTAAQVLGVGISAIWLLIKEQRLRSYSLRSADA
jgi:hypothetical protein